MQKLDRDHAAGPEVAFLRRRLNAVDAALCLTPARIPTLGLARSFVVVNEFEEDGWFLPDLNRRLVSNLYASANLTKGQLDKAVASMRLWLHRTDEPAWPLRIRS